MPFASIPCVWFAGLHARGGGRRRSFLFVGRRASSSKSRRKGAFLGVACRTVWLFLFALVVCLFAFFLFFKRRRHLLSPPPSLSLGRFFALALFVVVAVLFCLCVLLSRRFQSAKKAFFSDAHCL